MKIQTLTTVMERNVELDRDRDSVRMTAGKANLDTNSDRFRLAPWTFARPYCKMGPLPR